MLPSCGYLLTLLTYLPQNFSRLLRSRILATWVILGLYLSNSIKISCGVKRWALNGGGEVYVFFTGKNGPPDYWAKLIFWIGKNALFLSGLRILVFSPANPGRFLLLFLQFFIYFFYLHYYLSLESIEDTGILGGRGFAGLSGGLRGFAGVGNST